MNTDTTLPVNPISRRNEIMKILAKGYRRLRGDWDDAGESSGEHPCKTDDGDDSGNGEKPLCLS